MSPKGSDVTKMENNQEKSKKVDIEVAGKIELPKIDVSKYIGEKTKIVSAETHEGSYGYFVKVEGEVLETIGEGDKATDIRASAIIGLQIDAEGNIGWGEDTKMDKFLKLMGCEHYKDLVGKEAVIQTRQAKNSETEFLTFRGV